MFVTLANAMQLKFQSQPEKRHATSQKQGEVVVRGERMSIMAKKAKVRLLRRRMHRVVLLRRSRGQKVQADSAMEE